MVFGAFFGDGGMQFFGAKFANLLTVYPLFIV